MKKPFDLKLEIQTDFLIGLSFSLLAFPFKWTAGWLLAAVWHEFCHYSALKILGGRFYGVIFGLTGARIESNLDGWKGSLCCLAGPLGGLLLIFLSRYLPRLALCAFLQSLYNLQPMPFLDGGAALKHLLEEIIPEETGNRICITVAWLFLGALTLAAALVMWRYKQGTVLVILVGIMAIRLLKGNYSCKYYG